MDDDIDGKSVPPPFFGSGESMRVFNFHPRK
jgi:hypothetical protein